MEMTVRPLAGLILMASLPLCLAGCGVPVGVSVASYAVDGGLMWATDKSSNDHLLSMMAGQDCAMWRVIKGRQICTDHKPGEENPYNVDYDAPHREVGEGGMVTVYTASRQGGRLLTEPEAAAVLRQPPVVAARASAGTRTAELSDTTPAAVADPEPMVAGPARLAASRPSVRKAPATARRVAAVQRQAMGSPRQGPPRTAMPAPPPIAKPAPSQSTALMAGAPAVIPAPDSGR
jgi:hypothetical protein